MPQNPQLNNGETFVPRGGAVAQAAPTTAGGSAVKAGETLVPKTQPNYGDNQPTPPAYRGFTPMHMLHEAGGVLGSIAHIPSAIYHAATDPVTDEERAKYADFEKKNGLAPGTETSGAKRVGLTMERLIGPGLEHEQQRAKEERAHVQHVFPRSVDEAAHGALAGLHDVGGVVPLLGPFMGGLADKSVYEKDPGGALAQAATAYALPKVAKASPGLVKYVPVVGKPLAGALGTIKSISKASEDAPVKAPAPAAAPVEAAPTAPTKTFILYDQYGKPIEFKK